MTIVNERRRDVEKTTMRKISFGGTASVAVSGAIVLIVCGAHYYYSQHGQQPGEEYLSGAVAISNAVVDALSKAAVVALTVSVVLQVTIHNKTSFIRRVQQIVKNDPIVLDQETGSSLADVLKQNYELRIIELTQQRENLQKDVEAQKAESVKDRAQIADYEKILLRLPAVYQEAEKIKRDRGQSLST